MTSVLPHRRQLIFDVVISNLRDKSGALQTTLARWHCGLTISMIDLLMILPPYPFLEMLTNGLTLRRFSRRRRHVFERDPCVKKRVNQKRLL
jgi:hypothetical protein